MDYAVQDLDRLVSRRARGGQDGGHEWLHVHQQLHHGVHEACSVRVHQRFQNAIAHSRLKGALDGTDPHLALRGVIQQRHTV